MKKIFKTMMATPIGNLYIFNDEDYLYKISWNEFETYADIPLLKNDLGEQAKSQLLEYFAKKRFEFDLPLHLTGSEFRIKSMKAMQEIPYGETISYKEQAKLMAVKFSQAIGTANKNNKFSIVIPCHRVIKSNGEFGGYNGSEFDKKEYLLKLENSSLV